MKQSIMYRKKYEIEKLKRKYRMCRAARLLFIFCLTIPHIYSIYGARVTGKKKDDTLGKGRPTPTTGRGRPRLSLPAIEYIHDSSPAAPAARARRSRHRQQRKRLALWIDHQQVQQLSGYPMEIYVIREGQVLPYILDPNFNTRLPVIPPEVSSFNFTWRGGRRKRYRYTLDRLTSDDTAILHHPTVSVPLKGRVPKKQKGFQIELPCVANATGIAKFSVRLQLKTRNQKPLHGTPLHVSLSKRCAPVGSRGCPAGYLGASCGEALCYPHCQHGGACTAPGTCTCPLGYHGRYCQGGICTDKCLHGGKCIQKDKCSCPRGFYGPTCQYSKCVVPCVNGGICRGVNKCRCRQGFGGQHCEVVKQRLRGGAAARRCTARCVNGSCDEATATCLCVTGHTGRWCRRKKNKDHRQRVWL